MQEPKYFITIPNPISTLYHYPPLEHLAQPAHPNEPNYQLYRKFQLNQNMTVTNKNVPAKTAATPTDITPYCSNIAFPDTNVQRPPPD